MTQNETSAVSDAEVKKEKEICLKRSMTLLSASMFTIGGIIGTGIFVSPKGILSHAGSVGMSLVVWCVAGLLSMLGALCYIELGTTFPTSGCDYTYIKVFFGEMPSFLYLWVSVVILIPVSSAITSLTFANYVLQPLFPCYTAPPNAIRLTAALVLCLLAYINCRSVKWSIRMQNAFTFAKISALLVIITTGLYFLICGDFRNFENSFEGTIVHSGSVALALYSALYAYGGWYMLNYVAEELCEPTKNLPRAVCISLTVVTAIYILTNIAYFTVLTKNEILSSNVVAKIFGDRALSFMAWIMPLSVALSTFGSLNVHIFSKARLFFVGAREGHLPIFLSLINFHYFTPMPSLIFQCILSLAYLFTTEIYVLINYLSFVKYLFVTLSIAGMLRFRYTKPDMERPIKVNILFPLLFLFVCAFLVVFPFYTNPLEMSIGLGITLTGVPVYFATIFWKDKPDIYKLALDKITDTVKKILLCETETKCNSKEVSENEKIK